MSPRAQFTIARSLLINSSAADRLDALLWFVIPVLVLFAIPIGFVSNDGLGHSRQFAAGTWQLNPKSAA